MRFRDLRKFNLALLTKKGWRIQQNPNSLVHRVLKVKYFADRTFKEAQLGRRPSYAWRNIMATKDIVDLGSWWVIGNENVLIFGRIDGYPSRIPSRLLA